jgi:hypothetical protein
MTEPALLTNIREGLKLNALAYYFEMRRKVLLHRPPGRPFVVSVSKVEEVGNDGFLPLSIIPSFKVQKSTLIRIFENKFHQDFYNQFEDSPFREESDPPT